MAYRGFSFELLEDELAGSGKIAPATQPPRMLAATTAKARPRRDLESMAVISCWRNPARKRQQE